MYYYDFLKKNEDKESNPEIRKLFSSHWGIRISQLQRPVHTLIHGESEEGNEALNELLKGI